MDLRDYYTQAAEAAAPSVHAEDDEVVELTPKAVLLRLELEADKADLLASSNAEAGKAAGECGRRDLTCPECGKTFLSDKAMYGHLRSHPERGYKGASRPATACCPAAVPGDKRPTKKLKRKEAGELPATDMSATPPAAGEKKKREDDELKWPMTAKRGRALYTPGSAGSAPAAAEQSSSWRSREEEAAMILLEMASGGRTTSETQQQSRQPVRTRDAKHQIPEVRDEQQPMLLDHVAQNKTPERPQPMPTDHDACDVMSHQTPDAGLQQVVHPELAREVIIVDSQTPEVKELTEQLEIPTDAVLVVVRDTSTPANQQPASAGSGDRKRKKRGVPDRERTPGSASPPEAANVKPPARRIPSPASDRRYDCPTCGKSFPTHQALGGHMAGHNKVRHGARHDDPAVVQAVQNILAHRKRSKNTIIGGTGAAEGVVTSAVPSTDQEGAVAGRVQESPVAGAAQERHDVQPPAPVAQRSPQHVCPECDMTFRRGQALGGHMRKHWYPEKQQAKAAQAAATRSFDLNELPSDVEGGSQS